MGDRRRVLAQIGEAVELLDRMQGPPQLGRAKVFHRKGEIT
jgi:hypothetical protein